MFEVVKWEHFLELMKWEQGEHVTLIAPTGQGKTTLARELVNLRSYVMVLATKKNDDSLDQFSGYQQMQVPQDWAQRIMIYPPFPKNANDLFAAHTRVFRRALNAAYQMGGWCVLADEVRYLSQRLGLTPELELLWLQGRSLGVSLVACTQRPRHIPLEAYDAATHLFLWRDSDMNNVKRIAEIGGVVDTAAIMNRVPNLPQFQFVYVNTRTGEVVESKVELNGS